MPVKPPMKKKKKAKAAMGNKPKRPGLTPKSRLDAAKRNCKAVGGKWVGGKCVGGAA